MRKIVATLVTLITLTFVPAANAQVKLERANPIPHITVNGRPMFLLGGELSNSAVTSIADIDSVLPRMSRLGLNTVFLPIEWDLLEPEEGRFDFSLVDENIRVARQNNLKLVILWFGVWKNSMSCYAPLWFKRDTKRFPRAMTAEGKQLEIGSAFSDNVLNADKKAFTTLLKHIASVDGDEHTVVMVQVENEIGMLESARDHSPLAEKAFKSDEWRRVCTVVDIKSKNQLYEDEAFQACYYAKYVQQLASEGKKILDVPFYVNAAMDSRGRRPGEYPSAGPLPHLFRIWQAVAEDIDFCSPDIYDTGFKEWAGKYATDDNVLFVPESRMSVNSGVRALYTFGELKAIGFGPFAIDEAPLSQTAHITKAYGLLSQLASLLLAQKKPLKSWGLLFSADDRERIINDGNTVLTCRHYFTLPWDARATSGEPWAEGGAFVVRIAEDEYLIAGSGVVVEFKTKTEKQQEANVRRGEDGFAETGGNSGAVTSKKFTGKRIGIGYVDEVAVLPDGKLKYIRRENGDQDHQGRHARISVGDYKILHVKLYEY